MEIEIFRFRFTSDLHARKKTKTLSIMTIEDLKNATPAEIMLRYKRASLVLLLKEIKEAEAQYKKSTGKKAPALLKLIKENL